MKLNTRLASFFLVAIFAMVVKAQTADPINLPVYDNASVITVDGNLNEAAWGFPAKYILLGKSTVASGLANTATNGATVKPAYTDSSQMEVRFLKSGLKLYVSLKSNDKQICRFGDSWEGDGLFMKIVKPGGGETEVKLMFNQAGNSPMKFEISPAADTTKGIGVGLVLGAGTVNDSATVDAGFTAEIMVELDKLGFTSGMDTAKVTVVMMEPDDYTGGNIQPWGASGSFYKQWWGSEWGGTWRNLVFTNMPLPVELTSFTATALTNAVELQWSTASELNNKGFAVERSVNGVDFAEVTFVDGRGTTTELSQYSFVDNSVKAGQTYTYRLRQVDFDGTFAYSSSIEVSGVTPAQFELSQNYPNPFNPSTSISFSLPAESRVSLRVFDVLGQEVSLLTEGVYTAGVHNFTFDASALTSGQYIYQISAVDAMGKIMTATKKMMLVK